MPCLRKMTWIAWTAIGLLVGVVIAGWWPDTPLHAVATDRMENFAIATGFVDDGIEAVYFLDFLTGTLKAAVVSNQTNGFRAYYEADITRDLQNRVQYLNQRRPGGRGAGAPPIQFPQTPRYMLVTGAADIRRGQAARTRPSSSLVYVAEANTGIVMAYVLPWEQGAHSANAPSGGRLTLWAADQFTTAVVRTP